jgi:hypothetical protein
VGEKRAARLVGKLTGKNLLKRYGRLTPPVHLYTFTPKSLETLLGRCGFRVTELLQPAWGDPVWFPLTSEHGNRFGLVEKAFLLVDRLGAFFGHGEVLVVFARKTGERASSI